MHETAKFGNKQTMTSRLQPSKANGNAISSAISAICPFAVRIREPLARVVSSFRRRTILMPSLPRMVRLDPESTRALKGCRSIKIRKYLSGGSADTLKVMCKYSNRRSRKECESRSVPWKSQGPVLTTLLHVSRTHGTSFHRDIRSTAPITLNATVLRTFAGKMSNFPAIPTFSGRRYTRGSNSCARNGNRRSGRPLGSRRVSADSPFDGLSILRADRSYQSGSGSSKWSCGLTWRAISQFGKQRSFRSWRSVITSGGVLANLDSRRQ